ncbi:subunit of meta cleavage enzyme [Pusillimonas sp.]|uniref:subunit of meta cleavage enzyme n=1 Tax=Pusillimonas sp. TaxID=3040095 RepID=UPI0037CC0A48
MTRNWRHLMPTPDCYAMSRILYDIHHQPSALEEYKQDPDKYMASAPLPPRLKAAIRDNDIGAMYLEGVNPLLLRAHCLGLRIPESEFVASLKAIEHIVREEGAHG